VTADLEFPVALADVSEGGARCARRIDADGVVQRVIVLRRGETLWAYVNRCPHFSVGLDFEPGEFATYDGAVLMCAHHSAMFRYEDGYCFDGPCLGQRLDGFALRRHGTQFFPADGGASAPLHSQEDQQCDNKEWF
jgi:nitrite reductase/ring-hydroxylating ferredoxin subunit